MGVCDEDEVCVCAREIVSLNKQLRLQAKKREHYHKQQGGSYAAPCL